MRKCDRCGILTLHIIYVQKDAGVCAHCFYWYCECGEEMNSFEKNNVGRCAYCNYGSMNPEH